MWKKAREKKETEAAKLASVTAPINKPDSVIITESISANTAKGDVYKFVSHRISERVCILKKFSGTIISARWSEKVEGLVVYSVEYIDNDGDFADNEFYESEFTTGECSSF